MTAQWSGTVPVDDQGRALMNAMIWMDSRGAAEIKGVTGGTLKVQGYDVRRLRSWVARSGAVPSHSGKDPTAHILWIKRHAPEVYAATHTFLEPADYLNLRLSGRTVSSHDCITAHWITDNRDRSSIAYDDELIRISGLERSTLPELVPSASVVGTVTAEITASWGLPASTKVVTATGDVHSAVVGSGALADFAGHLYIGTSSWLSCHVPWKRTDLFNNQAAIPSALPGRYFIANEHETAGECLDHLIDHVLFADDELGTARPDDPYAAIEALAAGVPPGANGVVYTPWLNGERTPVDDHTIRGGWHHVAPGKQPGRPGAGRVRGGGVQQPLAARSGREVLEAPDGSAELHRWRRPFGAVVPDPRRRARSRHQPDGRPPAGERAGGRPARSRGARPHPGRGPRGGRADRQDVPP